MGNDALVVVGVLGRVVCWRVRLLTAGVPAGMPLASPQEGVVAAAGDDAGAFELLAVGGIIPGIVVFVAVMWNGPVGNNAIFLGDGSAGSLEAGHDRRDFIIDPRSGEIGLCREIRRIERRIVLALEEITAPVVATGQLAGSHQKEIVT